MTPTLNQARFLLCVTAGEFLVSYEPRKVYQQLPDESADKHGMVRVIDESGEDYLYPANMFVSVDLPKTVLEQFLTPEAA